MQAATAYLERSVRLLAALSINWPGLPWRLSFTARLPGGLFVVLVAVPVQAVLFFRRRGFGDLYPNLVERFGWHCRTICDCKISGVGVWNCNE